MKRLLVGTLAAAASGAAMAAATLGTPMGGFTLGSGLGVNLGAALPIAGSGLLVVAATTLVVGIRMARKKKRKS